MQWQLGLFPSSRSQYSSWICFLHGARGQWMCQSEEECKVLNQRFQSRLHFSSILRCTVEDESEYCCETSKGNKPIMNHKPWTKESTENDQHALNNSVWCNTEYHDRICFILSEKANTDFCILPGFVKYRERRKSSGNHVLSGKGRKHNICSPVCLITG